MRASHPRILTPSHLETRPRKTIAKQGRFGNKRDSGLTTRMASFWYSSRPSGGASFTSPFIASCIRSCSRPGFSG
eukprot:930418-Rhodomonas_salina.1